MDAEIAGVKTGLFWQNRAYGHPWVWEWFQRVTCLCMHASGGWEGCHVQHPEGNWPWKLCAPAPIWVCPYSLPECALFGQNPRSFCSPSLECLLLILPLILYDIPPQVSPLVFCGSGSRNLPFPSTPTATLCSGVLQAVSF